jgi:DNA-binding response OmpR family regulator
MARKILVVDDEPQLVDLIKIRLEANGYEVIVAYDGREALERARREKIDLIILDLMLPKIDGYMVCGLLKKDTRHSAIPIIMLTAKIQKGDMKLGKEMGADAYITKPFDPKTLLSKVAELLKKS